MLLLQITPEPPDRAEGAMGVKGPYHGERTLFVVKGRILAQRKGQIRKGYVKSPTDEPRGQ